MISINSIFTSHTFLRILSTDISEIFFLRARNNRRVNIAVVSVAIVSSSFTTHFSLIPPSSSHWRIKQEKKVQKKQKNKKTKKKKVEEEVGEGGEGRRRRRRGTVSGFLHYLPRTVTYTHTHTHTHPSPCKRRPAVHILSPIVWRQFGLCLQFFLKRDWWEQMGADGSRWEQLCSVKCKRSGKCRSNLDVKKLLLFFTRSHSRIGSYIIISCFTLIYTSIYSLHCTVGGKCRMLRPEPQHLGRECQRLRESSPHSSG